MKELEIQVAPNTEGTLPTEFGLLTELTSLTVSFANRQGTLPVEYSNLVKLQKMDFRVNDISGTVPPEYANLTDLSKFPILTPTEINLDSLSFSKFSPYHVSNRCYFMVNIVYRTTDYLDLRQMNLSGSLGDDICSLEFDVLRADCPKTNEDSSASVEFVCECCQFCWQV